MALQVNFKSPTYFFDTVFGATHEVTARVKQLLAAGFVLNVTMYTVAFSKPGDKHEAVLEYGTTSLLKGNVPFAEALACKKILSELVMDIDVVVNENAQKTVAYPQTSAGVQSIAPYSFLLTVWQFTTFNPVKAIKAIMKVATLEILPAKLMMEKAKESTTALHVTKPVMSLEEAQALLVEAGFVVNIHTDTFAYKAGYTAATDSTEVPGSDYTSTNSTSHYQEVKAKPSIAPGVINLRDAKAVGQKVHGTSPGSVYHCVALNGRIRLAAKIHSQAAAMSVRAEWSTNLTPVETKALTDSGFNIKGNYASIHLQHEDIPAGRVLGALVVGLGIKWDQAITSSQELVMTS